VVGAAHKKTAWRVARKMTAMIFSNDAALLFVTAILRNLGQTEFNFYLLILKWSVFPLAVTPGVLRIAGRGRPSELMGYGVGGHDE
jgi:hypothetical protein